MNTPGMIISPSIILLQPHVGRFHVSDLDFLPPLRAMFGQLVEVWHHAGATIVVVWHCIGI